MQEIPPDKESGAQGRIPSDPVAGSMEYPYTWAVPAVMAYRYRPLASTIRLEGAEPDGRAATGPVEIAVSPPVVGFRLKPEMLSVLPSDPLLWFAV